MTLVAGLHWECADRPDGVSLEGGRVQPMASLPVAVPLDSGPLGSGPLDSGQLGSGSLGSGSLGFGSLGKAASRVETGSGKTAPVSTALGRRKARPAPSPVLGFLAGAVDYINSSRTLLFSLVALALTGWFAFQLGSVLLGHWRGQTARIAELGSDRPPLAQQNLGMDGGLPSQHDSVPAWISESISARWEMVAATAGQGDRADRQFFVSSSVG